MPRRHRRQIRTKRATQYHECQACHVKRRWMSPSATPATQSAAASQATNPDQARNPIPWVPGLPRETKVDASFVPRLPRETKEDVTKCHACHAQCRGVTGDKFGPSAPHSTMSGTPATQNDGGCEFCATPATWNEGGCHQVPRLPRKVPRRHRRQIRTKRATQYHECQACHVKRRWISPSATPATQIAAASQATNPDQARHPIPWVPGLPRETKVDASFVPRLPRETKEDVTKCHACHAKCRGVTGDKSGPSAPHSTMSGTPATQNDGGCEFCATPATWNEGGCHQVPRLPRKVPRRHRRQIRTKRATQYHECQACHAKRRWMRVLCHACHVKRRWMSPSATPATQSAAASQATNLDQARHTVPWVARLPRKTTVDASFVPRLPRKATWNEGGCHQVPRLPRNVPRRHRRQIRTKRATQYHECQACHAKRRWMRVLCHACHVKRRWMSPSATPATQSVKLLYVKFVCVKLLYVTFGYVKLLYVKFVCWFVYVKLLYVNLCVGSLCMWS